MSTFAVPTASPAWKQEVNRRLAEHKGRKTSFEDEPHPRPEAPSAASRRAQEAAARVAARYAQAPSYSEVLAAEARAALRAAEAAQQAALEATAAVQTLLAGFESPDGALPAAMAARSEFAQPQPPAEEYFEWTPEAAGAIAVREQYDLASATAFEPAAAVEPVSVRWTQELPARSVLPADFHANRGQPLLEQDWWKPASAEPVAPGGGEVEMVEPALPIAGNIIEFPRELIAARRARPRLAEARAAAPEPGAQLSIFEVDPTLLPAEPFVESAQSDAASWAGPTWSDIELDEQPRETGPAEPAPVAAPALELPAAASLSCRLMATLVDAALVTGGVLGGAIVALHNTRLVPALHATEIGVGTALIIAACFYYGLFFALSETTPGMKYARIRLSTFTGEMPTRAERCARLMTMLLAVLPMGMGIAWMLVDDQGLCWHDRLSRTYLRES